MLRFDDVYKTYKKSLFTLSDINLKIMKGEFVLLIGRTGAGKSSLIKMIYGEGSPDDGSIFFDDIDITKLKSKGLQSLRRRIGLVFQDSGLIEDKNVYENTAYPLYIKNIDKDTVKKRVSIALRLVEMTNRASSFPAILSGGEKQKVSIARAFVTDPELIIADEPTGNIDKKAAKEIMEILKRINEKGTTLLVITHDTDIVKEFGKRIVELDEGRIIRDEMKGSSL